MDIRNEEHMTLLYHAVAVGMLGGVISWLRRRGPRKLGPLLVSVATSGFVGLLSHYVTNWLELNIHLQFFLSGIAGYSGGVLLDDAAARLRHLLNSGVDVLEKGLEGKKGE